MRRRGDRGNAIIKGKKKGLQKIGGKVLRCLCVELQEKDPAADINEQIHKEPARVEGDKELLSVLSKPEFGDDERCAKNTHQLAFGT